MNTRLIGKMGEDIACEYLLKNGYKILKRNYTASGGEIDIIAKKGSHLAFIEVKSRRDADFGYASEAVNYPKQKKIINTARAFVMKYSEYDTISFDVCEIYTKDRCINFIENAFTM